MTYSPIPEPKPLLASTPSATAPANVFIGHVQLRDLVVCPKSKGVVWYVSDHSIVEHDVVSRNAIPHYLAHRLSFTPVTLSALPLPSTSNEDLVLLAAGGQEAELFLGLYSYMSTPYLVRNPSPSLANDFATGKASEKKWSWEKLMSGSINNSVLLYFPPEDEAGYFYPGESQGRRRRVLPRLVVSNNDCTVKFFNVNTSSTGFGTYANPMEARLQHRLGARQGDGVERLERVGNLKLNVPVNHTSISPDGTTVLSCGDSPSIFLHRIRTELSGALGFEHVATYTLPAPSPPSPNSLPSTHIPTPYLPYAFVDGAWTLTSHGGGPTSSCFSTAWSADGSKFAVASQEGSVAVWDVRSGKPVASWETGREMGKDKKTGNGNSNSNSNAALQQAPWRAGSDASTSSGSGSGSTSTTSTSSTPVWTSVLDPYHAIANGVLPGDMMWTDPNSAPSWGVRTLKFKKNASGKEVLVFTQHASLIHIIDAERFERHDIIRIPRVRGSTSSTIAKPVLLQSSRMSMPVDAEHLPEPYPSNTRSSRLEAALSPSSTDPYRLTTWPHDSASTAGLPPTPGDTDSAFLRNPRASVRRQREIVPDEIESRDRGWLQEFLTLTSSSSDPNLVASMLDRFERMRDRNPESYSDVLRRMRATATAAGVDTSAGSGSGNSIDLQQVRDMARQVSRQTATSVLRQPESGLGISGAGILPSMSNPTRRSTSSMTVSRHARRSLASSRSAASRSATTFASSAARNEGNQRGEMEEDEDNSWLQPRSMFDSSSTFLTSLYPPTETRTSTNATLGSDSSSSSSNASGDVVVIPPFFDRQSAEEARRVLARHGISSVIESAGGQERAGTAAGAGSSTRGGASAQFQSQSQAQAQSQPRPSTSGRERDRAQAQAQNPQSADPTTEPSNDEMSDADIDIDCTPPRAVSPTTPTDQIPTITMEPPMTESLTLPIIPSNPPPPTARSPSEPPPHPTPPQITFPIPITRSPEPMESRLPPCRDLIESTDRLDIAGVTFDESGSYMYVATVDGVTEWKVEGTDVVWWSGGSWC